MKQLAVEWLVEQLPQRMKNYLNDSIALAKEMEKHQIVDAFSEGTKMIDVNDEISAMLNGFIYYGETYEKQ